MSEHSLQQRFAPNSRCFGCGPASATGFHLASFPSGAEVVARWQPTPEHQAFPAVLNGGVIGTLLDCHSNWTAAWHLMQSGGLAKPPCTVTAEYAIRLLRPTPVDSPVELVARVVASSADRATIEAVLSSGGTPSATCRGIFVAVKPGHPAYHQW